MLELSARPDTAHALGALGGMVYNGLQIGAGRDFTTELPTKNRT